MWHFLLVLVLVTMLLVFRMCWSTFIRPYFVLFAIEDTCDRCTNELLVNKWRKYISRAYIKPRPIMSKQLVTLSKQHSTLLPKTKRQQCRASFSWNFVLLTKSRQTEHVQFVSTLSKGRNFVRHCCQKRQQRRSNIRLCWKNRSTMLLWHCCWRGRGLMHALFHFCRATLY